MRMRLQKIETSKIDRNPNNPRGIDIIKDDTRLSLKALAYARHLC